MTRSIENNCTLQNSSLLPPSPPINNCYDTKGFMKHKALRYKLICSVDHVIGQAIYSEADKTVLIEIKLDTYLVTL